jgi:hypothetical protein
MKVLLIAAISTLLISCASDNGFEIPDQTMIVLPDVVTEEMAKYEIKQAIKAQQKVSEVGYEWRDTAKLIKIAQESLSSKRFRESLKDARKAKHQAINAYMQYEREEDAHERF